jgi:hypothetical protein
MNVLLENVKQVAELNSTFLDQELMALFKKFLRNHDNLGLKKDGVKIDLGKACLELEQKGEISEAILDSEENAIPSIWALEKDDAEFPVFRPFVTDEYDTDFRKALKEACFDIIILRTEFTERKRCLKILVNGHLIEKFGTLRELQEFIITEFEYPENRKQLLNKLMEYSKDKVAVDSFLLEIPAHKEHIVFGLIF